MALTSVTAQLTVAREHALLGEYTSAMVYYAGVLAQVDRYVHILRIGPGRIILTKSQASKRLCVGICKPSLTHTCSPSGALVKLLCKRNTIW